MGGSICGDEVSIKKGPWTPEEDVVLASYIQEHGPRNWRSVPINTGLMRCSKSCRLRWTNYLRPGIKRGNFTPHEERIIIRLQGLLGNRWAAIASYLPQRTDNDIKNYWNTHLKKKIKKEKEAVDRYATTLDSTRGRLRGLAPRGCYPGATIPEISTLHPTVPRFLHTPPTYASSMENISRLLKTWMKPISDSAAACTSTSTTTLNKISTAPPKLEQHESIRCINDINNNRNCSNAVSPQEQLDSLLSLENLCIDGSDNSSRDAISRSVQSAVPDGEEVKQKFNRNQAPVSFFETWLMDEEIEQMDGLMMQWQEQQ